MIASRTLTAAESNARWDAALAEARRQQAACTPAHTPFPDYDNTPEDWA